MKELSIEQKAKRYDEALEKAKNYHSPETVCNVRIAMENLFPELKESEDEKIRKALMQNLKERFGTKGNMGEGLDMPDVLAWLEKQGEQKPVDKAETKFHKGDWINGYYTNYKVLSVNNEGYEVEDTDGNKINILFENEKFHHLWTIRDTKDGDVLHCWIDGDEFVLIYKGIKDGYITTYGHLYQKFKSFSEEPTTMFCRKEKISRRIYMEERIIKEINALLTQLFSKMHDAGYEWDAEKKELKKIENEIEIPFGAKDSELEEATYYISKGFHAEIDDDKVVIKKGEKPTAWSEEDEQMLNHIICDIESLKEQVYCTTLCDEEIVWLKSLKDRYTWKPSSELDEASYQVGIKRVLENPESYGLTKYNWKPSDEQMKAMQKALVDLCGKDEHNIITGLYYDLKKLKE